MTTGIRADVMDAENKYSLRQEIAHKQYMVDLKTMSGVEAMGKYRAELRDAFEERKVVGWPR